MKRSEIVLSILNADVNLTDNADGELCFRTGDDSGTDVRIAEDIFEQTSEIILNELDDLRKQSLILHLDRVRGG